MVLIAKVQVTSTSVLTKSSIKHPLLHSDLQYHVDQVCENQH